MKKLKIGVVCYPTYGGSGVVATELGKALADKGHDIHFVSYTQPARLDSFNQHLFYHEVAVSNYPLFEYPPYLLALAGKLVDVVKYHNLDLLHVHYAIPHATAAFLAKMILTEKGIHIPIVTTLHGTDISLVGKDVLFEPVVSFSINQSDAVTAVSDALKRDTIEFFEVKKDIDVIPNFIDFSRFSQTPRDHFKKAIAPQGERIIIHISNFRKLKRVDNVIRIFTKILEKMPARLLLVGDGPERVKAEQLCRELGTCNEVRFLGKQDAVEEILSVSDLFLMPSESESFGLAALEAMACRVPVVSSNVGGLPEVNLHGKTGFLADVDRIDEMASHAIYILCNEQRLQQFRENAYNQALQFHLEKILPQYVAIYNRVLENN